MWSNCNLITFSNLCQFCVNPVASCRPPADVEHMAIDWLTGNFYFVDRTAEKIFVCDRDGTTCVTVVQLDLVNPKGLALDPLMG